jgi:hypothetical protein
MSTFQLEDNLALLGVIPRTYALVLVPLALYLVYKVRTSIFIVSNSFGPNLEYDSGHWQQTFPISKDYPRSQEQFPSLAIY